LNNISAREFKKILDTESNNKDIDYIDVCSRMEYQQNHINGVRNVPLDELLRHLNEFKDKKKIYIHCFSGSRSQYAVQLLHSKGVTAELINVDGGIIAWHRAGFPVIGL